MCMLTDAEICECNDVIAKSCVGLDAKEVYDKSLDKIKSIANKIAVAMGIKSKYNTDYYLNKDNWTEENINRYDRVKDFILNFDNSTADMERPNVKITRNTFKRFNKESVDFEYTSQEYLYIMRHRSDIDSLLEGLFCSECGEKCKFGWASTGFYQFCSKKCTQRSKIVRDRNKATCLERYGKEFSLQAESVREKIKATCNELYGGNGPSCSPEVRKKQEETCFKNHGARNPMQCSKIKAKADATIKERYNVDNISQSPEIQEKKCKSFEEHYGKGIRYSFQAEEVKEQIKQTNIKKRGVAHPAQDTSVQDKMKQTNIKRRGVPYAAQDLEVQDKIVATNMKRRNVAYPMQDHSVVEKSKQTCLEKYNKPSYTQTDEYKERVKETCLSKYNKESVSQVEEFKEKMKNTNNIRYGFPCVFSSPEIQKIIKETLLKNYNVDNPTKSPIIVDKIRETKRRNGTFNSSKSEDILFELLQTRFPKVNRQYKSEEYPFSCDFYIPINKLYIEHNEFWTHGKEPFDSKNKEHQKILNIWKEKSSDSNLYKKAVYIWTKSDPKKLKMMVKNKLRYKIFYTLEEALKWLDDLKDKQYYKNLKFKSDKYNKLWSDNSVKHAVVDYCLEKYNLGLGEINKKHIVEALKKLY